jgi:hypothetical protein
MLRRLPIWIAVGAGLLWLVPAGGASAAVLHDFSPTALRAYVDFRFSSAVPDALIYRVLAAEGFSERDLALLRSSPASLPTSSSSVPLTAASSTPSVKYAQAISQDTLACPTTDPSCELDTEPELDIAVNPANSSNLVGVFQLGRYPNGGAVDTGWAASFNGGKTWPSKGAAPGLTVGVTSTPSTGTGVPFERASDPVVAFDRKHGTVYLESIGVSVRGCAVYCDSAITVNISKNGGKTFGQPVIINENVVPNDGTTPAIFNDKNWIASDNNPTSPFYGRTYAVWDQVRCPDNGCNAAPTEQPVMVSTSDDGGATWTPAREAVNEHPGAVHQAVGAVPVVMPNGHVVIVYADANPGAYTFTGQYKAIRSTDGGATWSAPSVIATADPYAEEGNSLRAPNIPSPAVSGNTVWVAFQDQRFAPGRNDILLTSSTDEGTTWSAPLNATPGEVGLDHFSPDIAAVGSKISLTYRTHTPTDVNADPKVDAVYRAIQSGLTVSGPTNLYGASDANLAAFTTVAGAQLRFFGDYAGIAADAKGAHPIWAQSQNFPAQQANPTNTHQRAFSAAIA